MNGKKKWYTSKTLWVNILAASAGLFGANGAFGHVFSPDEVAAGLGVGNILLRLITNKGLVQ